MAMVDGGAVAVDGDEPDLATEVGNNVVATPVEGVAEAADVPGLVL